MAEQTRAARIAALLRHPQPVREPLAYELRGPVVQLLAAGTTVPTWQAPPALIAAAIDLELTRAEEKDTPTGSTTAGPGAPSTPHALVLETDAYDYRAACACGHPIGRTPQSRSVDVLVCQWEQHTAAAATDSSWPDAAADSAWSAAIASLRIPSIGAS